MTGQSSDTAMKKAIAESIKQNIPVAKRYMNAPGNTICGIWNMSARAQVSLTQTESLKEVMAMRCPVWPVHQPYLFCLKKNPNH